MHEIYSLVSGPLVWIALLVFVCGSAWRIISAVMLAQEREPVILSYMSLRHSLRSVLHWVTPFGATNMRMHPGMTVATFVFHICLVCVPVFLCAHVILWREAWDMGWAVLPDAAADLMTLAVIGCCVFFLVRRITRPEVRYLTDWTDYAILAMVAAPFVTGFWAAQQWPGHSAMTVLHILSGEIMLAAVPFTRLSHMIFFPLTRGHTGSEFGAVRHARDW